MAALPAEERERLVRHYRNLSIVEFEEVMKKLDSLPPAEAKITRDAWNELLPEIRTRV